MLLSKIMLRTPEDVQAIMSGKLAVKYAGLDLDAMRAVAEASHRRSLADFQKAVKQYRQELEDDVIVRAHLGSLYDAMLEQNLCRLVEPYSRVQVFTWIYIGSLKFLFNYKLSDQLSSSQDVYVYKKKKIYIYIYKRCNCIYVQTYQISKIKKLTV